jgi:pimeloyl-ACP methyl ester carboxylesterase
MLAIMATRGRRRREIAAALAITAPEGIAEEHYVTIGGVEQWIQIRGEDRANPVMLILHGGPGSPYAVFTPLIRSWESHFTVVQWDRRGVGKTRARSGKAATNSYSQMGADAVEVIRFLQGHLSQEKIILFAGSMGTLLGLPLVQQHPELFSAIVCTDMYTDMRRNEALGYRLTFDRVKAAGNTKAVAALAKIGADPATWDMREWQVKMDWTMKTDPVTPNGVTKLLFPLALTSPIYSLGDVRHLLAGFLETGKQLHAEVQAYSTDRLPTRFEVPFFLFQGASDILTITSLAQDYFATIDAPHKQMALIQNASHFAAFTQPELFRQELVNHVLPVVR